MRHRCDFDVEEAPFSVGGRLHGIKESQVSHAPLDKALLIEYHIAIQPPGAVTLESKLPVREYASAGGVVVDATGARVLALLRPKRLGPDERPEVRLPKGHIEPGESRAQTAVREVGEEAGLSNLELLADLGHQIVEFDWKGHHYVRDESSFLMRLPPGTLPDPPEKQFRTLWLKWEEALARLTFEAEREWIRRAQVAWAQRSWLEAGTPVR